MDRTTPHHPAQPAIATASGAASRDGAGSERRALVRRPRDFGVGYGSSSGYASQRSYAAPQAAYFRCR